MYHNQPGNSAAMLFAYNQTYYNEHINVAKIASMTHDTPLLKLDEQRSDYETKVDEELVLAQQLACSTYNGFEAAFVNCFFESSKEVIAMLENMRQAYLPFNAKLYAIFQHPNFGPITIDQLYSMYSHKGYNSSAYDRIRVLTQDFCNVDYSPLYNCLHLRGFTKHAHCVYVDNRINVLQLVDYFRLERELVKQAYLQSTSALLHAEGTGIPVLRRQLYDMTCTAMIAHGYHPCTVESHSKRSNNAIFFLKAPIERISAAALRFALRERTKQLHHILQSYQYYIGLFEKNTASLSEHMEHMSQQQAGHNMMIIYMDTLTFLHDTYIDKHRVACACVEQIRYLLYIGSIALSDIERPINLRYVDIRLPNILQLPAVYSSYSNNTLQGSCRVCLEISGCCHLLLAYTASFHDKYSLLQPQLEYSTL